jgi:hypothetical protein
MRHDVGRSLRSFHALCVVLLRVQVVAESAEEDGALRVISSSDPVRYFGHAEARARQLIMMPEASGGGHPSLRKALAPRPAGHLWTLRNPAGLTVALRARDLDGRQRGWWLSLDGRVVITSARIRGVSQRAEAEREVRAVLRLLIELDESAGQKWRKSELSFAPVRIPR